MIERRQEITTALRDVIVERYRQINDEHFSAAHDDEHTDCSLAIASAYYATFYTDTQVLDCGGRTGWPWGDEWLKLTMHRQTCVKAAALLIAEIERIDRAGVK